MFRKLLITLGIVSLNFCILKLVPQLTASYMLFFPSIILSTLYGSGNASVALCLLMALYIRSANLPNEWVNITFFIFSAITIKLLTTRLMREKARAGQALANLEQEKKERDHFVASLTHDLQTPLTAAKLHAEMLFRNIEPDQQVTTMANAVLNSLLRMEGMIRDILDVSQIRSGRLLPVELDIVDLSELTQETIQDLVAVHGFRFIVNAEPEVKGLFCVKSVRRILENLCSNAVKYGDESTPIKISLTVQKDMACLAVNNRGTPIAAEVLPELFRPFNRGLSQSKKKGWGLGLPLVKGLVEAQGGSVTVTSDVLEGTTFSVFLPLDAPDLV